MAKREFKLLVARTMGYVQENGNYTGLSLPLKTPAQREFAAYVLAAINEFEPPAKQEVES